MSEKTFKAKIARNVRIMVPKWLSKLSKLWMGKRKTVLKVQALHARGLFAEKRKKKIPRFSVSR